MYYSKSIQAASFAAILLLLSFSAVAQIRVAVEDGSVVGSGADIVSQLNDDTWADFSATQVSAADIDSLAKLANYDVVILGDSGHRDHDWTAAMSTALRDWVSAGGSAVLTGWGNFGMDTSNTIFDPLDEVFPTQNIASTDHSDSSGTIMNILQPAHPIFTGLTDFSFPTGCCIETNPLPVEANDVQLATIAGDTVVATKLIGSGASVYLGPIYMGSVSGYSAVVPGLRSGDPDRLLEQAVVWAANNSISTPTLPAVAIPTMSGWSLILLSMFMGLMVFVTRRRLF